MNQTCGLPFRTGITYLCKPSVDGIGLDVIVAVLHIVESNHECMGQSFAFSLDRHISTGLDAMYVLAAFLIQTLDRQISEISACLGGLVSQLNMIDMAQITLAIR